MIATGVAIVAMVQLKNVVNRSEAMRAMQELGQEVLAHQRKNGSVPSEAWVDREKEKLPGYVRLRSLRYRARWIGFESSPDAILGYTEFSYRWLFSRNKHLVLRLSGVVEWIDQDEFKSLLAEQQSQLEIEMTRE